MLEIYIIIRYNKRRYRGENINKGKRNPIYDSDIGIIEIKSEEEYLKEFYEEWIIQLCII